MKTSTATEFLEYVNSTYAKLHKNYEKHFWTSYMGDHSVDEKKVVALKKLDAFRSNEKTKNTVEELLTSAKEGEKKRLQHWLRFFSQYQIPTEGQGIQAKITDLEVKIAKIRTKQKEGYIEPTSKKFISASTQKMRSMMRTESEESIRKACYDALEAQADWHLPEYVELIQLRNAFANTLGYEDFYDYKLQHIDQMSKDELFSLFGSIKNALGDVHTEVKELAKTKKGLRKPWNFAYMMSGDFTREEDEYFQFFEAVPRWGQSFSAWGIDFQGGTLTLDLVDREGKHNNGFCHWPDLVQFVDGKRVPGSANFTCNVVPGQVGSGATAYMTLFHEGGHAAHLLNTEQTEVCLNHEYAPATSSWAEVHSMFIDSAMGSIEWLSRYAKNADGESYSFDLYERKVNQTAVLRPWRMLSIIFVAEFERAVYEMKSPTPEKLKSLAKKMHEQYYNMTEGSLLALNVPHLYASESACNYHGYGLAEIAVHQWREYFYKKYGYIVDNPRVAKEMKKTWSWGASKSYAEAIKEATGKPISSKAIVKELTQSPKQIIQSAKKKLKRMESVKEFSGQVNLNASIRLVHGKQTIATNKNGFEKMSESYAKWVLKQK